MEKKSLIAEGNDNDARRHLEIKKLDIEIAQLRLPWWKKPSYLGVFLPVAIATLTLAGAVFTGYFDAERVRLKNEKILLVKENKVLADQSKDLKKQIVILKEIGTSITDNFSKSLIALTAIANQKDSEIQRLLNEIDSGSIDKTKLKQSAKQIRNEIREILDLIQKGEIMLNKLPIFK
ncbi:MAG: hypothetical protein GY786_12375 [Proteobacteria bacterium]|nr:hypothetical protein [Pseudomonadota bacterium]